MAAFLELGVTQVTNGGFTPEGWRIDLSFAPSAACQYVNPCSDTLVGTVVAGPDFGSFTIYEIIAREWLPESPIQVVCQLTAGQTVTGSCSA